MIPFKASFRGAGFYVISWEVTAGRRQPVHSLPFEERGAASVDMGRAPRTYSIEAIVVGPDYAAARDKILDALEERGPGTLVHPLGRVVVVLDGPVRISQKTTETNAARIAFKFIESFDSPPQITPLDTSAALKAAVLRGRSLTASSFASSITGLRTDVADFVREAHLDALDEVLQDLYTVNGAVSATLSIPAGFAQQIDAISRQASYLIDIPRRLFDAIDGALELITAAATRVLDASGAEVDSADVPGLLLPKRKGRSLTRAVIPIAQLGSGASTPTNPSTPDRVAEAEGTLAIQRHSRASGLFNLANASTEIEFDSADDARRLRDLLANALADLADSEPDMDAALVSALKAAAASTMAHLSAVAGLLPEIVEYTPPTTVPAEVIAWELYADAERADDIVLRNPGVKHPGFVQGKVALEVKSR